MEGIVGIMCAKHWAVILIVQGYYIQSWLLPLILYFHVYVGNGELQCSQNSHPTNTEFITSYAQLNRINIHNEYDGTCFFSVTCLCCFLVTQGQVCDTCRVKEILWLTFVSLFYSTLKTIGVTLHLCILLTLIAFHPSWLMVNLHCLHTSWTN